jgi:hypothetical protein
LGLSYIDSTAYLYWADLGFDESPTFDADSSVMLLVGKNLATFLPSVIYVAEERVLVDSYYSVVDGGAMKN